MASARPRRTAKPARPVHVAAKKTRDAQFLALLRIKCLQAASVGALTAAGEAVPGLSRVLGLFVGELLDAKFLAATHRELIEGTFAIYELDLPAPLRDALVAKVQVLGTSASIAGDAIVRQVLKRSIGRLGSMIASRVLPLTSIASSAFSNATVTYAVGKRAQAVALLHGEPITAVPDALRAFSGIDERRVLSWTIEATKSSLGRIGNALRTLAWRNPRAKGKQRR